MFQQQAMIWLVVLVAFIYIPIRLGGFGKIFDAVQQKAVHNPTTFHAQVIFPRNPSSPSSYPIFIHWLTAGFQ
jgi:solute:Na+ symporter, SSS family